MHISVGCETKSILQASLLASFMVAPRRAASATNARAVYSPIVPGSFNVIDLGIANDTAYNPRIYRDGSGGGTVNGFHMMVFSDTYTSEFPKNYDGTGGGIMLGIWSNTAVYFGLNGTRPTSLTDFGEPPYPKGPVIPYMDNEPPEMNSNGRFLCWPDSNVLQIQPQNTGIGVFPFGHYRESDLDAVMDYNSLVTATVEPQGPTFERTIPQLFNASEGLYGSFSILHHATDGHLYMFQANINGLKMARVKQESFLERSEYTFWNGLSWVDTPPDPLDPSANVFNFTKVFYKKPVGPASGDVFYSNYHDQYLAVFTDGSTEGEFFVAYPLTEDLTGKWSEAISLYKTPEALEFWNYAGHAYPGWDPSGKTLLLSYTWGKEWTRFARVDWDTWPQSPIPATKDSQKKRAHGHFDRLQERHADHVERFLRRDPQNSAAIPPALYARAYESVLK